MTINWSIFLVVKNGYATRHSRIEVCYVRCMVGEAGGTGGTHRTGETRSSTTWTAGTGAPSFDVTTHLPLVWRVARQVARRLPAGIEAPDLVGAGTLGLLNALSRYEVKRGERFDAYAEFRIRGAILDQLREMDWKPRSLRSKRRKLDDAETRLQHLLGRLPAREELAAALGVNHDGLERLRRAAAATDVVLDIFVDFVADERTPGTALEMRERRARLARALDALPRRQQQVVQLYYVEQKRLRAIGEQLQVTESRVCQILRSAVERLRIDLADA